MAKPYCLEHIPHHLLRKQARDAFLRWLSRLPLSHFERKMCLEAWVDATGWKLERIDVLEAQAEPASSKLIKIELTNMRENASITPTKARTVYKATLVSRTRRD